jgi:hypothetical protein
MLFITATALSPVVSTNFENKLSQEVFGIREILLYFKNGRTKDQE